jgi:hypothetical protein
MFGVFASLIAEAREVAPAHVVDENHDKVRLRRGERRTESQHEEKLFEHVAGNVAEPTALHD